MQVYDFGACVRAAGHNVPSQPVVSVVGFVNPGRTCFVTQVLGFLLLLYIIFNRTLQHKTARDRTIAVQCRVVVTMCISQQ